MLYNKTLEDWDLLKKDKIVQELWDESCLHRQWVSASDMKLLSQSNALNMEEWEAYFIKSGECRDTLIENLKDKEIINNFSLIYENPDYVRKLNWDVKKYNYDYGRSEKSFTQIGEIFQNYLKIKGIERSLDFCIQTVYLHIIIETWEGKQREIGVVKSLRELYPQYTYKFTDNFVDSYYSVDFEVFQNDILKCGIQVKPPSYFTPSEKEGLIKARLDNFKKHSLYEKDSKAIVYFIVANKDGSKYTTKFKQSEYVSPINGRIIKKLFFQG